MLHHANVDRLYAMWQAIYYTDPVFTTVQTSRALYGTAAGFITADSPLRPFFAKDDHATFHTSRSVQAIRTFGYTYPEINDWSQSPSALASSVRAAVNDLYKPATGSSAGTKRWSIVRRSRESRDRRAFRAPLTRLSEAGPSILDKSTYGIEIAVDRAQVPLPSTIELYLQTASGAARKIGSTSLLAMPTTGTSFSELPLGRVLRSELAERRASLRSATGPSAKFAPFSDNDSVLSFVQQGLRVLIKSVCSSVFFFFFFFFFFVFFFFPFFFFLFLFVLV